LVTAPSRKSSTGRPIARPIAVSRARLLASGRASRSKRSHAASVSGTPSKKRAYAWSFVATASAAKITTRRIDAGARCTIAWTSQRRETKLQKRYGRSRLLVCE
jgi:hypothetical protein